MKLNNLRYRQMNLLLHITNPLGISVYKGSAHPGKQLIDLLELPNGLYFVQIKNIHTSGVLKFIKAD